MLFRLWNWSCFSPGDKTHLYIQIHKPIIMEISMCKTWGKWTDCSTWSKLKTEFCCLSFFCFPSLDKKTQTWEKTRKPSGSQWLQVSHSGLPSKWGFRGTSLKPMTECCLPIPPKTWLVLASHSIAFILFVLYNENKRKMMNCTQSPGIL
jgi:hypothetical protein